MSSETATETTETQGHGCGCGGHGHDAPDAEAAPAPAQEAQGCGCGGHGHAEATAAPAQEAHGCGCGGHGQAESAPQAQAPSEPAGETVVLTDVASTKVKTLLEQEGRTDLALRVAVQPGGCSGLRYQLFFDDRNLDGDERLDFNGVTVVVDRMSGPYLGGAKIDFVDTIEKQGFTIDNPNATGSCACGDSFH